MAQMKVNDIEISFAFSHLLDLEDVIKNMIRVGRIQPQGLLANGHEIGRRGRIAAGEKRHLMAPAHQLLG